MQWTTRDAGEPVALYGTDSGKLLQASFTTLQVIWVAQPHFQYTYCHADAYTVVQFNLNAIVLIYSDCLGLFHNIQSNRHVWIASQ